MTAMHTCARERAVNGDDLPVLTARNMAIEGLRAALVLALVFLSFAHTPIGASSAHQDVLTAAVDASWCGDAPDPDGKTHAPCHACRIGSGADLPPPCDIPLAPVTVADVAFGAVPVLHLPAQPPGHATARGPPLV
jgi:hypothetical protein